ncbi:MAG: hypothetical protein HY558_05265 [Euryarchaeota archaeon]|nr:hypothetical protein [Euryarchaeota archaeon]
MRVENPADVVERYLRMLELLDEFRGRPGPLLGFRLVGRAFSVMRGVWRVDWEFYRQWQTGYSGDRGSRGVDPDVVGREVGRIRELAARHNVDLRAFELRLRHNDYPGLDYSPHPEGGYQARIK